MYKLPKWIIIIIFISLLGLQTGILFLIVIIKTINNSNLTFSLPEFYIIFTIVSITAVFIGFAFVCPWKSWTIENLVERMENPVEINKAIIGLQQKKAALIIKTPILSQIPDPIQVIISPHKIGTEKKKDKK